MCVFAASACTSHSFDTAVQSCVSPPSVCYPQGDYNMTPDRHLGAAWIDKCCPDLLITESTYATTIRDSKRCRERDILKKVTPCFSLARDTAGGWGGEGRNVVNGWCRVNAGEIGLCRAVNGVKGILDECVY